MPDFRLARLYLLYTSFIPPLYRLAVVLRSANYLQRRGASSAPLSSPF